MLTESEKTVDKALKRLIENELGGWSIKMVPQHISGLPDRVCLLPGGILFFAEIKTTKKTPFKLQLRIHAKLRALGFMVYVIDSTDQIHQLKVRYTT